MTNPKQPGANKPNATDVDDNDILLGGETATTGADKAETSEPARAPAGDAPAGVSIDGPA